MTAPSESALSEPYPVTVERLRRLAGVRGDYVRDLEDGVVVSSEGRAINLQIAGTELVAVALWPKGFAASARRGAARLINEWNRDQVFPTLHTRPRGEGFQVFSRQSTSIAPGFTDGQLADAVDIAVDAATRVLKALDGAFSTGS